jgi:hypothetical protein
VYIENMMRCTKMFSLIALTSAFVGGLVLVSLNGTATAATATPDLCVATGARISPDSGTGGCVYSDTNAPVLGLNVCWDGTTARIKGGLACPTKQPTYFVKYGEVVSPLSGEIIAYAPLPDACELVTCETSDINSQPLEDGVACCNPVTGICTPPNANGDCTAGEITWCKELENNGNGTVTCHE